MKDKEVNVETWTIVAFTWTIKNFSKLDYVRMHSDTFYTGSHSWRILIYPKATNAGDGFRIHLSAVNAATFPVGGKLFARFRFTLINQLDREMTKTCESEFEFNAERLVSHKFKQFINTAEFRDPSKGYLVNDTCIIVADVCLGNPEHDSDSSSDVSSYGELTDFRSLCEVEKDFIPLLDDVCSKHPSLIESHQKRKRGREFNKASFRMLGRVLYLLKTTKVKYMDEVFYDELQHLWEELGIRFDDLTWLEPHIQSALNMKSYTERAAEVKNLKGNVVVLEGEMESLKTKMVAAEAELEIARRELMKAEQGFVERELDDTVGY